MESQDWVADDAVQMKENVTALIEKAADNHIQAVFFLVRDLGENFYVSGNGVWSKKFDYKDPGFDPVKFACDQAHKNGLQFHAVTDVLGCRIPDDAMPPGHSAVKQNGWRLLDKNLKPVTYRDQYLIKPYEPAVITLLKETVSELVLSYPVDGVMFKGLVFPSEALDNSDVFMKYSSDNKKMSCSQSEWAVHVVNHLVEALSTEIKMYKPYLMVSAQTEAAAKTVKIKNIGGSWLEDYHQSAGVWLENGWVDFISPVIYQKMKYFDDIEASHSYGEQLDPYVIPVCTGDEGGLISIRDLEKEAAYLKNRGRKGIILSAAVDMLSMDLTKDIFSEKVTVPYLARTHHSVSAVSLDVSKMTSSGDPVRTNGKDLWGFTDSRGVVAILRNELPRTLSLSLPRTTLRLDTRNWRPPYRYVARDRREAVNPDLFIELRRSPGHMSTDSSYSFLFKASQGEVSINGQAQKQYDKTGVFFADMDLPVYGALIRGEVISGDRELVYEDRFYGSMPDTTTKHIVDIKSVHPQSVVSLPQGDICRITFKSDLPDSIQAISLFADSRPVPVELNGNTYTGDVHLDRFSLGDSLVIQVAARMVDGKDFAATLPVSIRVLRESDFPVLETAEDFTQLSYSQGQVRLGGPYAAEYPKGVRLVSDGKIGTHYRVRLAENFHVYVEEDVVTVLPPGTPRPAYHLTTLSVKADSAQDVIYIPWPEPVPYILVPEPEQHRLRISLFGAECSSTWLSHYRGLEMVDYVTWEQVQDGRYDILVYLKDNPMWGYELLQNERALVLNVKHVPARQDLKIAVEAGHGGPYNWGAVGLSGLKEKDVNRDTADRLIQLLKKQGYTVLDIREGDEGPYLRERWLKTDSLQADVLISIHANAAGGGYLRVGGTSTYYNNPFWREFSEIAYDHLLDLDLDEFGIVGSFNYMMCRMTQRPALLVEQAFMSHAEDENKLADPEFRQDLAQKIADALDEYVEKMLNP